jgi:membrane protein
MKSSWVETAKATVKGYGTDGVPMLAAALAFYAMFAIAPLMIVIIEIGAALLGGNGHHAQVRDQILAQLQPAIGSGGTKAIASIVQATFNQKHGAVLAQIISWVVFAAAATGLLGSVEAALDDIWDAKEKGGLLYTILIRVKSFAIIAGVAIVMVALMVLTAWTGVLGAVVARILNAVLLIAVATGLFAVLYKWLPKTKVSWKDVFGGAAVTAVLTVVGQYLIGLYLGRASTTSVYGAAGSLAAILLWLYYSAMIFLVGAEITKAYANTFGSKASAGVKTERGSVEPAAQKASATG